MSGAAADQAAEVWKQPAQAIEAGMSEVATELYLRCLSRLPAKKAEQVCSVLVGCMFDYGTFGEMIEIEQNVTQRSSRSKATL